MEKMYLNIDIPDTIDGHKKLHIQWEKGNTESAKEAQEEIKKMFTKLKESGYRIYKVKKVLGFYKTKGEEIKEYDPNTGEFVYQKDDELVRQIELRNNKEKDEEDTKVVNIEEYRKISIKEVEKDQREVRYEEMTKFEAEKEEVDLNADYVAGIRMRRG